MAKANSGPRRGTRRTPPSWAAKPFGRRRLLAGAGALGLGLALTGCGDDDDEDPAEPTPGNGADPDQPTPTPAGPVRGGTLEILAASTPMHYDQHQMAGIDGDGRVYNQLFKLGSGQEVLPDLAEGYETPEPNVYVFSMRQDVNFHDLPPVNGRKLTAEDVAFTVERSRTPEPEFTNRWMWMTLDSLDAIDEHTLQATFQVPFAPAIHHFSAASMGVIAHEVVEEFGDLKDARSRIGSGPFMLEEARRDEMLHYVRNPGYFDPELPYLDEIRVTAIPDRMARIVQLRTGDADLLGFHRGIVDIDEPARGADDVNVQLRPYDSVSVLAFNHAVEPFGDERVRQAISRAIDAHSLIRAAGGGEGGVLRGLTHPNGPPFALPESELEEFLRQDMQEAAALLDAAGHGDGFETSVTVFSTDTTGIDIVSVIAQELDSLGIRLNIDAQEPASYMRKLMERTFELVWVGDWTPALDPAQQYFGSLRTDAAQNWWNASDAELDQLIDRQIIELDTEVRASMIQDLERMNFEKVIALPLFAMNGWTAWKDHVQGYDYLRALQNARAWQDCEIWLDH